jgi:uncharacterized protein DUF6603
VASIIEIAKEIQSSMGHLYLMGNIEVFARSIGYDFEPVSGQLVNAQTAADNVIAALDDMQDSFNNLLNIDDPFGDDAGTTAIEFAKIASGIYTVHDTIKEVCDSFSGGGLSSYISEIMGGGGNAQEKFAFEFLERTVGLLVYEHFNHKRPATAEFLEIIGVLENSDQPADPDRHRVAFIQHRMNWNAISEFLGNPTDYIQTLYQWGADAVGLNRLLDRLQWLVISRMIPASVGYATTQELIEFENIIDGTYPTVVGDARLLRILLWEDETSGFRLELQVAVIPPTDSLLNPGLGFALLATLSGSQEIYISDNLVITINGGMDLQAGIYLAFMPGKNPAFKVQIPDNNINSTSITIAKRTRTGATPHVLLGSMDGNRLEIGGVDGAIGIEIVKGEPPDLFGEIQLNDGRIVVQTKDGDGFITKILPDLDIDASFDITIGWSTERAIYFRGSGGIDITIPIHQTLGPIKIDTLYLSLDLSEQGDIDAGIALSAGVKIGPLIASVDRIGAKIRNAFPDGGGNKGPLKQDNRFKPPNGIGLAIKTEAITGGGFLEIDTENERYAGILQLEFKAIGLVAIGLITTRMPDGSKGFSMLMCINVTFNPAITLPYNFKLIGVGGLIGIHRSMIIEVIRQGIKNRTLDSIMFPEDPILNAAKIISDLRAVFPPTEDRYVLGPMAKLGWNSPPLITGDIGILIEIPQPIRIAILGQLALVLPTKEKAIVEIHLDMLGVIDFDKCLFSFDASLYDSKIVTFTLSGDAAMRLSWGAEPNFALSIGGLHPRFKPPPKFPTLRRLRLSLGSGNNPRLNLETYQAITSNSTQFGAKLEAYAKKGKFSIQGYLSFDALFIFSPFSFTVDFGAGVSVKVGSKTLFSISLDLTLAGTSPWRAKGKATFKILFVKIKIRFDKSWGKRKRISLPEVDPTVQLLNAFKDSGNWAGILPEESQMAVSLRTSEEETNGIVVHPMGRLEIRQRVLPLGVTLEKFGNAPVTGPGTYTIDDVKTGIEPNGFVSLNLLPVKDYFARGQFENLSNAKKISSPSFEKFDAGVRAGSGNIVFEHPVSYTLEYETEVIDENRVTHTLKRSKLPWRMGKHLAAGSAAGCSPMRNAGSRKYSVYGKAAKVRMKEEEYIIAGMKDLGKVEGIPNNEMGMSHSQARREYEAYLEQHPEQHGEVQIVLKQEVAA